MQREDICQIKTGERNLHGVSMEFIFIGFLKRKLRLRKPGSNYVGRILHYSLYIFSC